MPKTLCCQSSVASTASSAGEASRHRGDEKREAKEARWFLINAEADCYVGKNNKDVEDDDGLDVFAKKATSTMAKRASS